jgi:hypothetical protein
VAVDDEFFINLINLTINNSVYDGLNGPLFDIVLFDLLKNSQVREVNETYMKESSNLSVLEVCSFLSA